MITVPSPSIEQSNIEIRQAYSELTHYDRILLRKSRRNAVKGGYPVCYEWLHGNGYLEPTECFFRDVGKRPTSAHQLTRYDKTKSFCKGNAYWSNVGRQALEFTMASGQVITLAEASDLSGITNDAIVYRLKSMTIEQAILTPKSRRTPYPFSEAMQFFEGNDISDQSTRIKIRDEQERFSKSFKYQKENTADSDSMAILVKQDLVQKLCKVLSLNISIHERTAVLAFLACPQDIRKRTYSCHKAIIERCRNDKNANFSDYGDRGIDICERWVSGDGELNGLYCFVIDVGPSQPGMELDRIDNDKGYERSNCRWVTRKQNIRNTFRAEDIAERLNAMVEQRVAEELNR